MVRHYDGHQQEVRLLLPLGDQLISADSGGDVIVWDVQDGGRQRTRSLKRTTCYQLCFAFSDVFYPSCLALGCSDIYLRLNFDPNTFDISAMMHPSTYLNKVLLGSSQGALQLWNIKTR